jgi:hypothetical protein
VISSKLTAQDLATYKLSLSLHEKNRIGQPPLLKLSLLLAVNFDPILFASSSYTRQLTGANVLQESLLQVGTRPTHKRPARGSQNLKFSLADTADKSAISDR